MQLVRFSTVAAVLMLCSIVPSPSAAAPGTNSFTGSASGSEWTTFATIGSMSAAHQMHTATLLNNGKVLIVGGGDNSAPSASAELYDPDTGIWSSTGSLNFGRYFPVAILLNSGRVLVAGGHMEDKDMERALNVALAR